MKAAHQYQMDRLQQMCEKELCKRVTAQDVASLLSCAETHEAPQLRESCIEFIRTSDIEASSLETLPKSLLVKIIVEMQRPGFKLFP